MALPVEVKVQAVPHVPVHLVKRLSCAFAQSPRSPRPYRISQSIWFPLFRLKHPFYTQRPFAPLLGHRFATRGRSGDTRGHCPARALAVGFAVPAAPSLRAIALRRISPLLWARPTPADAFAPQVSQVPDATFQTRRPSMPRHAFRAANRIRRFFSASR